MRSTKERRENEGTGSVDIMGFASSKTKRRKRRTKSRRWGLGRLYMGGQKKLGDMKKRKRIGFGYRSFHSFKSGSGHSGKRQYCCRRKNFLVNKKRKHKYPFH